VVVGLGHLINSTIATGHKKTPFALLAPAERVQANVLYAGSRRWRGVEVPIPPAPITETHNPKVPRLLHRMPVSSMAVDGRAAALDVLHAAPEQFFRRPMQ
jgi:hypothetical protein